MNPRPRHYEKWAGGFPPYEPLVSHTTDIATERQGALTKRRVNTAASTAASEVFSTLRIAALWRRLSTAFRHWFWLRKHRAIARKIPTRRLNAREILVLQQSLREAGIGL